MGLSHATWLGRLQAGGHDGDDPTSWSAIKRSAGHMPDTLQMPGSLRPALAGCDGGGFALGYMR